MSDDKLAEFLMGSAVDNMRYFVINCQTCSGIGTTSPMDRGYIVVGESLEARPCEACTPLRKRLKRYDEAEK